jgi:hypothetical protein
MWLFLVCLICVAIISAWAIVDAVHSATKTATDDIIGELRTQSAKRAEERKVLVHFGIELALNEIKELLSISCPQCGEEHFGFDTPVAEQRVRLEEHMAEHKSGKLERRTLDDIVAERHAEQERKHKEFEASHQHLFAEEEENESGATEKPREEKH